MHSTGDWIGLVGLVVGIASFAFAVYERLARIRQDVAIADALDEERRWISAPMLAAKVVEMQSAEEELHSAIREGQVEVAQGALFKWRGPADELRGFALRFGSEADELVAVLATCGVLLDYALSDLASNRTVSSTLLTEMSSAAREARLLADAIMWQRGRNVSPS